MLAALALIAWAFLARASQGAGPQSQGLSQAAQGLSPRRMLAYSAHGETSLHAPHGFLPRAMPPYSPPP